MLDNNNTRFCFSCSVGMLLSSKSTVYLTQGSGKPVVDVRGS